ncbi:MAG: formate dehydrogenase accessory protein FdhE [Alphaproteobacteria bacterium]
MENRIPWPEPGAIAERLQALEDRESASEDYIRFRIALLKAQSAVQEALACSPPPPTRSRAAEGEREAKLPVLGADDVPFDRALLTGLARALAAALPSREGGGEMARLCAAAANDPALLEELARNAAFDAEERFFAGLSERMEASPEALFFLGRALAAPFVAGAVRRLKECEGIAAPESSGRCPYCGSPPGLAKLRREEGRRVLFCSLCGEGWEFERVRCPFCAAQGGLTMLAMGPDDPRWIESCERCGGYLKTVDERRLPQGEPVIPLVEATATLYLDLVAEREGYASGPAYVALL